MKKRGFTLIEMLIVIVIIGILAGALIPRIGSARDKANDTAREANVRSLATAMVSYGMDHNGYPSVGAEADGADITTTVTVREAAGEGENAVAAITAFSLQDFDGLSAYSIPTDNFDQQPVSTDHYYYRQVENDNHFVIYTLLSAGLGGEGGNCDFADVSDGITYDDLNAMTEGDAFCYFQ